MANSEEEIRIRLGFQADAVTRGTQAMLEQQREAGREFKHIWENAVEAVGEFLAAERAIEFGKELVENAHKVELLAERLNLTTDEVQRLQHVANLTGTSVETIAAAFDKTAKAKEAAIGGDKKDNNAFGDFGISIEQIRDLSPEELFTKISESIEKTGVNAKVTADLMQLLGRNAGELKPLLREFSELRGGAAIIPEQQIKDLAQAGRVWKDIKEGAVGIGSVLLSGALHPIRMAQDIFGADKLKPGRTNEQITAEIEAENAKPWKGEDAVKTVDLTKQAKADATKAAATEKEIAAQKEKSRQAGLSDGQKLLEIQQRIRDLDHDIKGAPFEGLSPAETAALQLEKEKAITQEKTLQKSINAEATDLARRIGQNERKIDEQGAEFPTIEKLAKRRGYFGNLAREFERAKADQINARENATDIDYFDEHTLQNVHISRADQIRAAQTRENAARGKLEDANVIAPELNLQKLVENTNAMIAKLNAIHGRGGKEDPIYLAEDQ